MCKTNIILKTIFTLAFILITIFTGDNTLFWPLLLYIVFLGLKDNNKKSFIISIIVMLLLIFIKNNFYVNILIILLLIGNILFIYITSFSKEEIDALKEYVGYYNIKNRKKIFYNKYVGEVKNSLEKNTSDYDIDEEHINNKTKRELDKLYLYGKVRFYGYNNQMTSILSKWKVNDLIFLLISLALLIFLRIIWS